MAKRNFRQVMLVFGVPKDAPPIVLLFKSTVMDYLAYTMGSFDAYVDTSIDYATWFAASSVGPIMGDITVSRGRVLGGIACAQVTSRPKLRSQVENLQARVTELETATAAKEAHMQEEIIRALARERELW